MAEKNANYQIVDSDSEHVVLQDVGPWDKYMTITNAAESVVAELGITLNGRRLFYYDSGDELTELLVKDGRFAGFAPVPQKKEVANGESD